RFYQDWLRKNFREALLCSYREAVGRAPCLEFRIAEDAAPGDAAKATVARAEVQPEAAARPPQAAALGSHLSSNAPRHDSRESRPNIVLRDRGPANDARTASAASGSQRRFASLDALVIGEGNRLAVHAAHMIVEQPGKISPLLVYGPTALGKTHLL